MYSFLSCHAVTAMLLLLPLATDLTTVHGSLHAVCLCLCLLCSSVWGVSARPRQEL
jgi:hypothetical protein